MMNRLISFLILISCSGSFSLENCFQADSSGCVISVGQDGSPMVVQTGLGDFIYPKVGESTLTIARGYSVDLVCPGRQVAIGSTSYDNFVTATCVLDSSFTINGTNAEWREIQCSSTVIRTGRFTGNQCENNGKEIEIGFDVAGRFLRTILICFDETTEQALYSHANITASINQRIDDTPRPTWILGTDIYKITSVDSYYGRSQQRETINAALGLSATSTKYIQDDAHFLSRGHMTARSDNFYPGQQNVTFFLPNVAPQWQTCNQANWQNAEKYVRDYAESHNTDLLEWTGVYGVTTLPHEETGEAVELYLYNVDGKKALPVPEFYWKVAYEPKSQKAVVIIVINNPYLATYKPICEDVSSQLEGLHWHKNSQKKGFGYACTVDSFRKVVSYLPSFIVKGLLL